MKNAFVFYESFYDILQMLPSAEDWRMLIEAVCEYAFTGERDPLPTPTLEIAFKHFQISIDSASARYDKAVEEGKKGGRPSKKVFIPPDEWIVAIEKHGSIPKAAKALGLAKSTLYQWVSVTDDPRLEKVRKSENLNVYDNVSVSESVYDNDSEKRNNKNRANGATDAKASPRVSEKKLAERKIKPSKEETIALLRSLQEEREKERRENEDRREGGTG